MHGQCRRQRLRSFGADTGRESDAHQFRAASVDLLHPASQKYSVDSRFRGGGDTSGYGGDSLYQAGTGAGSTENEYAYVWETTQDDVGAQIGRRLDYTDPMMQQHVQHCPQKSSRGFSRQTSLAPSGEYESTTSQTGVVVGRPVMEQNLDDNRQFGQFA